MRCDCCPLSDPEDVCPEAEGNLGLEHKDGVLGCKHPRSWAEKRSDAYATYLGEMGLDMGIEMDLSPEELNRAIEICKHMVGMDYKRPYHRHGKDFYKAWRNYYEAPITGDHILDKLPRGLLIVRKGGVSMWYELTQTGLDWLGRQLKIKITRG